MLKNFSYATCAFDCKWVPCPDTARRLLSLPAGCSDREAMEAVWRFYAKEGEERPFLKLALCKVVTIAAVIRTLSVDGDLHVRLYSQHCDAEGEAKLISTFLERVAAGSYQLWDCNSASAGLPLLKQRAIALDAPIPRFCKPPKKPWEDPDYHDRSSESHVDIMDLVGSYGGGAARPKLHELAAACGLPGKLDVAGGDIPGLYLEGRLADILQYNETDAVTTHLLMLRIAHVAGRLEDEDYEKELQAVERLVREQAAAGKQQFEKFWAVWKGAALPSTARKPVALAPATQPVDQDKAAQLMGKWKEVVGRAKVAHGQKLAAALKAVKAIRAEGDTVTLYFGANEFSRNLCREQVYAVGAVLAEYLEAPGMRLDLQMGNGPAGRERPAR